MSRRTLAILTWLTVLAAVLSALWLAWRGSASPRFGFAPLVLGRPTPPAETAPARDPRRQPTHPGRSGSDPRH